MRTHYEVLGVSMDAPEEVVRAAYRALSQRYHPDKNPGREDECALRMKALNAAWEVLSDPWRRREYDRFVSEQPQEPRVSTGFHGEAKVEDLWFILCLRRWSPRVLLQRIGAGLHWALRAVGALLCFPGWALGAMWSWCLGGVEAHFRPDLGTGWKGSVLGLGAFLLSWLLFSVMVPEFWPVSKVPSAHELAMRFPFQMVSESQPQQEAAGPVASPFVSTAPPAPDLMKDLDDRYFQFRDEMRAYKDKILANPILAAHAIGRSYLQRAELKEQSEYEWYASQKQALGGEYYERIPVEYRVVFNPLFRRNDLSGSDKISLASSHLAIVSSIAQLEAEAQRVGLSQGALDRLEDELLGPPQLDRAGRPMLFPDGRPMRAGSPSVKLTSYGTYAFAGGQAAFESHLAQAVRGFLKSSSVSHQSFVSHATLQSSLELDSRRAVQERAAKEKDARVRAALLGESEGGVSVDTLNQIYSKDTRRRLFSESQLAGELERAVSRDIRTAASASDFAKGIVANYGLTKDNLKDAFPQLAEMQLDLGEEAITPESYAALVAVGKRYGAVLNDRLKAEAVAEHGRDRAIAARGWGSYALVTLFSLGIVLLKVRPTLAFFYLLPFVPGLNGWVAFLVLCAPVPRSPCLREPVSSSTIPSSTTPSKPSRQRVSSGDRDWDNPLGWN